MKRSRLIMRPNKIEERWLLKHGYKWIMKNQKYNNLVLSYPRGFCRKIHNEK